MSLSDLLAISAYQSVDVDLGDGRVEVGRHISTQSARGVDCQANIFEFQQQKKNPFPFLSTLSTFSWYRSLDLYGVGRASFRKKWVELVLNFLFTLIHGGERWTLGLNGEVQVFWG